MLFRSQPARFDDVLTVRTRVTQSQRRMLRFGYEILNTATGVTVATGETLHVICDRLGHPKSLPEKYRIYFPELRAEGNGEKEWPSDAVARDDHRR